MRLGQTVLLGIAMVTASGPGEATTFVAPAEQLRGLAVVGVDMYAYCGYDDFQAALDVIRPQVERRLREAGLRIESEEAMTLNPSTPRLQIVVECSSVRLDDGAHLVVSAGPDAPDVAGRTAGHVFLVHMKLFQRVSLVRNPRVVAEVPTYSWNGYLSAEGKSRPFAELRGEVLRGVEQFIGVWRDAESGRVGEP